MASQSDDHMTFVRLHRFLGNTNRVVTLKLIRYSLLMVLAPLASFYLSYYVLFKQDQTKLMWCGLIAVLVTNIVVASYVVMAWYEKDNGSAVGPNRRQAQKAD
jgi:hypothetical protein